MIAMTTGLEKKSVLVVDDDERMLRALDKVLSNEGASVTCSNWAAGAVKLLAEKKAAVDLVIIDLIMPAMSGLTAIFSIHSRFPKLPIIVLTAFGSPEVKAECFNQGAVAFLEKPLDSRVLVNAVRGVLVSTANGTGRNRLLPNGPGEDDGRLDGRN
ncbi:MAG: response regulator [Limisphaerales bacterium]